MPSYLAYITYGTNREKREEIYKAYCTKAPENGKIIEELLVLKDEKVSPGTSVAFMSGNNNEYLVAQVKQIL